MSETLFIEIETERLVLRNMTLDDVSQDYVNWLNDPEINKYLSCANTVQTKESCLTYVQSYEGRNDRALIGIFLKDHDLHIGNLTISSIDWHNKIGDIGISIGRKELMGKGFAKEALNGIMRFFFNQLGLHRLQAGVNALNLRSLKLFIKCGFKIEGLLRESNYINGGFEDGYILSVLETDL
jgi:ribosomal-protein-alanine N-acetyltransferase